MTSDVQFRPLRTDERGRLFAFYRDTLRDPERVITLYEWRLDGLPHSGSIRTCVAEREGRLVGAMNAVPARLSSDGEIFEAAWQQDSIVHPDVRGEGIGSRLTAYTARQSPIALAKGTVEPMYRLRKRMGFADVPNDTYLLRPLTPLPRGAKTSLKRRALFPALWLAGRMSRRLPTPLETVEIDRFDASFDRLADALARRADLRAHKPAGYLNWRYFTCPIRRYRVFAALRAGEPAGAVVLRGTETPDEDAWIVDLIVDETDSRAVHALVNVTFEALARSEASALRAFASCPRTRRVLLVRGFVATSETPHFTYHLADGRAPVARTWIFSHGDGDTELLN